MPVQLSYGGISWKLPKRRTLKSIQDDIKKAMKDRSPLSVPLDGGETLILNGAGLNYVLVFDDKGDPSRAPSSVFDYAGVISGYASDTGVISAYPGSATSSGTEGVISAYPGRATSSGTEGVISAYPGRAISSGTDGVISVQPGRVVIWRPGPG
jgi:hypothetical protein